MKLKSDFITNSSSTSFILSKPIDKLDKKLKITFEMTVDDLLDQIRDYKVLRNTKQIDDYLEDINPYNKEEIKNKYYELINQEKEIIVLECDSDNGGLESLLRFHPEKIKFGDDIKIEGIHEG